ncbi:hypothetical protein A0H81_09280 [Grifola frondosa]|uniref:R3H domain-containing protein n=1 Tax=Grifola frondosa TaxID=5627 RepID=A0A1C7M1Z3_GRIFR|nr:hypothetical protein A0H81_09280 [Grifola frondosa]
MSVQMTWADQDEDVIADIEDMFIENPDILKDKMARNKLFRAVQDGDFDTDELSVMSQPAKRRKDKNIPPELQEQWEKDRQKKAENKRARALARLVLAANPFAQHKGGKKGQKAMLAAARLDADIEISNRVVDLVSLEQQIRRFLTDIGGKREMVLPPADKETRKRVHELAAAFNLKSQSRGNGASRYTTLIKTSRSGIQINEKKVPKEVEAARTWRNTVKGGGREGCAEDCPASPIPPPDVPIPVVVLATPPSDPPPPYHPASGAYA